MGSDVKCGWGESHPLGRPDYINHPGYRGCGYLPFASVLGSMSQSEAFLTMAPQSESTVDVTTVDSESGVQALLDALGDADCRAILEATGEEALTAAELSSELGLSKSTAYRKLDTLSDLSLVEKRTRIRRSGKHATEFRRRLADVSLTASAEDGLELRVTRFGRPERFGVPTTGSF